MNWQDIIIVVLAAGGVIYGILDLLKKLAGKLIEEHERNKKRNKK